MKCVHCGRKIVQYEQDWTHVLNVKGFSIELYRRTCHNMPMRTATPLDEEDLPLDYS